MSERLTDFDVANQLVLYGEVGSMDFDPDVLALAREVQEYRALRPTCPTCGGKGWSSVKGVMYEATDTSGPCFDCTDGKMPLDQWVALLVETLRSVTTATIGSWDSVRNDIDAVLKMAGVT